MIYIKTVIIVLGVLSTMNSAFSQINYSKRIKKVAKRAVDMIHIYAPIGYKDFKVIYDKPEMYIDSAIQYLRRPSYERLEFSVVSLSMHKLQPDKYLAFVECCFESYYDRKIDDSIMNLLLAGFFGNPFIRDNHVDDRVQALLKKLIENQETSTYIKNKAIKYRDGKVPKSYEGPNPDIIKVPEK